MIPDYVDALVSEIRQTAGAAEKVYPIHTIFFGGGTPSLLPSKDIGQILAAIGEGYDLCKDVEITLEANPSAVDERYFSELRELGVNRISMGVQSSRATELKILEREHGYFEAIAAIRDCRKGGFDNISVDLIYGLPSQELEHWQQNLENALRLEIEHISLYALSVEHGTPLANMVRRGLINLPDPDRAADMYEWTLERMAAEGFVHYEISNWAARNASGEWVLARHNLQYWRSKPYFGFGAGAHGFVENIRTATVLSPAQYIERLRNSSSLRAFPRTAATATSKAASPDSLIGETMMMGLRLIEGINKSEFQEQFKATIESLFGEVIAELTKAGLLEETQTHLRLTRRGLLLGNQVFMRFI